MQEEEVATNEKDKIESMLLERYKDRSLQPGEPGGMSLL